MKRWLTLLVPVILLVGLIAWRLRAKSMDVADQNRMRQTRAKMPPLVTVAPAQVRDIVHTFEAVGTIDAPLNVRLAPKLAGRIDYLQVHEGDRVRRGQVLVRLDPSDLEAQVHSKEATLAEAQQRLAQAQLTQSPVNVQVGTQISQQEAAVASAEANYNQAHENSAAKLAAAQAAVTDAQGRINNAVAAMASAQAAIQNAQANLDNAQVKYNRVYDLYKQGFTAAQDVDDARTTVKVQEAVLDVARRQYESATAQRDSYEAQKQAAEQQVLIGKRQSQADIAATRAVVTQAKAGLKYAAANRAQMPAYVANLSALRAAVAAARADLHNAQAQLAYMELRSPLDGFVTGRMMDPGSMAMIGTPIVTLQETRQVWVTIPVPEEVSRKIYEGQAATVRLDALPGKVFRGKVQQINPAVDPQSRQFSIRVVLDNSHSLLRSGMFARATMVVERVHNATVVPLEAVKQGPQGTTVTVVNQTSKGSVAETRAVVTGASDPSGIAIVRGVQAGEKVVVMCAVPLRDGQPVRTGGERDAGGGRGGRGARSEGGGPGFGQGHGGIGAPGAPGAAGASGAPSPSGSSSSSNGAGFNSGSGGSAGSAPGGSGGAGGGR